jgi:hypothetical protein
MHRTLTFSSVVACLFLAVAAALVLEPWAKARSSPCAFEIHVESDQSGLVQVYYDLGGGLSEPDSALQPILAGHPALLRFALPYGRFQGLRFDPLDRDARLTVSGARIADGRGRTLVSFAPSQFREPYQIQSLAVQGGSLVIVTTPGATDPHVAVGLSEPFTIPRPPLWREIASYFAVAIILLLVVGWARNSPVTRLDRRAGSAWRASVASPGKALVTAALLATVAANYPVIFAGKSLVSPNLGVALLYGQSPWLPGFQSSEAGDPHKADVAAVLWHHLPLSMIERRAVFRDHELPLWNRYDSAGLPLLGQGQSCFGDPLHLLPILADGAAWAWDLKFLLAKWAFACGIGLCTWSAFRHLPTAILTAVSASFIGFFVFRINHPAVFSLCYSPWILYCWLRCLDAPSDRGSVYWLAALVGANWAEMNSGTAKEAYVLLLSMNFSGLCLFLADERPGRRKAWLFGGLAAAGILFALISSPVWYTFYRALKGSYTSYDAPSAFQIQPGMLIGLFDEAFYRPFQFESGVVNPSANVFILVGLLWATVRWRSFLGSRRAVGLFLSTLPALALVFGVVPPALVARVPFLGNILHIDNTFSCPLIVIFAVLSGFGWRAAWERLGTTDGRREAVFVVSLLLLVFAAYLGTAQSIVRSTYASLTWGRNIRVGAFIHAYGWSLVAGTAVFLGSLAAMRRRAAATPAMILCAFVGFGSLLWRGGLKLGGEYPDYVVRPTARADFRADSPAVDAVLAPGDSPWRAIGFHNDLLPGWSIVYGIEGISGPDALINPYYRDFMDAAGINRVWDWRYIVEPEDVVKWKPVFDLLGVRYYLGYHLGDRRPGKELTRVLSADMDVFESRSPWPRAFFTDSAAVYSDVGQFSSWLKAGDGRPFAAVDRADWAGISPAPRVSGDLGTRKVSAAVNYRLTTNTTSFTVSATGPGFIVLTEAYERGNFRVTVNGRPTPYLRVNDAFKAIYVDGAGTYEVRFEYWPRGLSTSLVLASIGIGLLLMGIVAARFLSGPEAESRPWHA